MTKTIEIVCNSCGLGNGDCFCDHDWTESRLHVLPNCDFDCGDVAEYDAATFAGMWAYMCKHHYLLNAKDAELGLGKGQRLVRVWDIQTKN